MNDSEVKLNESNESGVTFSASLPMRLHRALDAVLPPFRALFADYDLTEQQWRVLRVLWEQPGLTQSALSHETLIPSNSLVGVLDRLERRALIVRLRSTSDRRLVHVRATPAGLALGEQIRPKLEPIYAALAARLGAEKLAHLYEALDALDALDAVCEEKFTKEEKTHVAR